MTKRWLSVSVTVALGLVAVGCSQPAAQIPESTVKFDSTRDKVELGGIGGSGGGLPNKGGSNRATGTKPQ